MTVCAPRISILRLWFPIRKSLKDGAIAPGGSSSSHEQTLDQSPGVQVLDQYAVQDLPKKAKDTILFGSADKSVKMIYADDKRSYTIDRPFEGVVPNMERRFRETDSNWTREELSKYQAVSRCEVCDGARLKPEARAVKITW